MKISSHKFAKVLKFMRMFVQGRFPKYFLLFRYRALLHKLGDVAEAVEKQFVQEGSNMDSERKYLKGASMSSKSLCKAIDALDELVSLVSNNSYEFILPPEFSRRVVIQQNGNKIPVSLPYGYEDAYDSAAMAAALVHDGKFYHNDYSEIIPPRDFEYSVVYTKRCDRTQFRTITLEEYVVGYGLTIEDLSAKLKNSQD